MTGFLKGAVVGGIAGAFVAGAAIAVAGTGVGGIFNLGQTNTVNATSSLAGVNGNTQLDVQNAGAGAAIRAIGSSGRGVVAQHTATSGGAAIEATTANTSPTGSAVVAHNTGGGPAFSAIVNAGVPPLRVNSATAVSNLNADLLDGRDASTFAAKGDLPSFTHVIVISGNLGLDSAKTRGVTGFATVVRPGGFYLYCFGLTDPASNIEITLGDTWNPSQETYFPFAGLGAATGCPSNADDAWVDVGDPIPLWVVFQPAP